MSHHDQNHVDSLSENHNARPTSSADRETAFGLGGFSKLKLLPTALFRDNQH